MTIRTAQAEDAETMTCIIRPLKLEDEPFLWEMLYQAIHVPEGQTPLP
jgi:hypothetical protein